MKRTPTPTWRTRWRLTEDGTDRDGIGIRTGAFTRSSPATDSSTTRSDGDSIRRFTFGDIHICGAAGTIATPWPAARRQFRRLTLAAGQLVLHGMRKPPQPVDSTAPARPGSAAAFIARADSEDSTAAAPWAGIAKTFNQINE